MAGRRPTPTRLKVINGTAQPSRINKKEPKIKAAAIPNCPAWMNAEGKKEWRRIAKVLTESGIVTQLDYVVLATFCQMWGRYVEAEKAGQEVNVSHITQMRLLAVEMGMSPSSRSKVEAVGLNATERNPFDDL